MHSLIYQISTAPIAEENFLREDGINEGDMVSIDYSDAISGEERQKAIERLVEKILPKGMFTLNPDNTLTYNGGIKQWRNSYCKLLQTTAQSITPDNITNPKGAMLQLRRAIVNPLNTACLFVMDSFGMECTAERSAEFMNVVDYMTKRDILYIGGVCDYRF